MIPWHALCADLNWGEPLIAGLMAIPTPCSPGFEITRGSGKFETPWARMQAENLYAAVIGDLGDEELVVGGFDEPQPATISEAPASVAASDLVCMSKL